MYPKIDFSRRTEFQTKVYQAIMKIPEGKVSTYKLVAGFVGCRSAQAVGQALRRNPFNPEVPCHRVVNTFLRLHGFGGKSDEAALAKKEKGLRQEGVTFEPDGKISMKCLFKFKH